MGKKHLIESTNAPPPPQRRSPNSRAGFTLTEVMIASVVIGIGVSASLFGMTSSLDSSGRSQEMLTGMALAENLFQLAQGLAFSDPEGDDGIGPELGENGVDDYDDVNDFDGSTFAPPLDAAGVEIDALTGWSQEVSVYCVDLESMERLEIPEETGLVEMEVVVSRSGRRTGCFKRIVANR